MSTHNDPNINRPDSVRRRVEAEKQGWSAGSIILGSLAALAIVFGLFYMMSDRNPTVATPNRPAVTTNAPVIAPTPVPGETTGTGAATAPAIPPATNR